VDQRIRQPAIKNIKESGFSIDLFISVHSWFRCCYSNLKKQSQFDNVQIDVKLVISNTYGISGDLRQKKTKPIQACPFDGLRAGSEQR